MPSTRTLEIHHIPLSGTGDATLILEKVDRAVAWSILVDGGHTADGEDVAAYVRAQGVAQLTTIVTTHYDIDHSNGIKRLLQLSRAAGGATPLIGPTTTKILDRGMTLASSSGRKRERAFPYFYVANQQVDGYFDQLPQVIDQWPTWVRQEDFDRPTALVLTARPTDPVTRDALVFHDGNTFLAADWLLGQRLTPTSTPIAVRVIAVNSVALDATGRSAIPMLTEEEAEAIDGPIDDFDGDLAEELGDEASNAGSIALVVEWGTGDEGDGGFRYFVGGDLTRAGEISLTKGYLAHRRVHALKLDHHGSAGSNHQGFLAVVRPSVAFASNGIDNSEGHPSVTTMKRLELPKWRMWGSRTPTVPNTLWRLFCTGWYYGPRRKKSRDQVPLAQLPLDYPRTVAAGDQDPPLAGAIVVRVDDTDVASATHAGWVKYHDANTGLSAPFAIRRAAPTPAAPLAREAGVPAPATMRLAREAGPPAPTAMPLEQLKAELDQRIGTSGRLEIGAGLLPGALFGAWLDTLPDRRLTIAVTEMPAITNDVLSFSGTLDGTWTPGAGGGALSAATLGFAVSGDPTDTALAVRAATWTPAEGALPAWTLSGTMVDDTPSLTAAGEPPHAVLDLSAKSSPAVAVADAWSALADEDAAQSPLAFAIGLFSGALDVASVALRLAMDARLGVTTSVAFGPDTSIADKIPKLSLLTPRATVAGTRRGVPLVASASLGLSATLSGAPFDGSSIALAFGCDGQVSVTCSLDGVTFDDAVQKVAAWAGVHVDLAPLQKHLPIGDPAVTGFDATFDLATHALTDAGVTFATTVAGATLDARVALVNPAIEVWMLASPGIPGHKPIRLTRVLQDLLKPLGLDLSSKDDIELDRFDACAQLHGCSIAFGIAAPHALTVAGHTLPPGTLSVDVAILETGDAPVVEAFVDLEVTLGDGADAVTTDLAVGYEDKKWTLGLSVASAQPCSLERVIELAQPYAPIHLPKLPTLPVDLELTEVDLQVTLPSLGFTFTADVQATPHDGLERFGIEKASATIEVEVGESSDDAASWSVAVALPLAIRDAHFRVEVLASGPGGDVAVQILMQDAKLSLDPLEVLDKLGVKGLHGHVADALKKLVPTITALDAILDLAGPSLAIAAATVVDGIDVDVLFAIDDAGGTANVVAGIGVMSTPEHQLTLANAPFVKKHLAELGCFELGAACVMIASQAGAVAKLPPLPFTEPGQDPFAKLGRLEFPDPNGSAAPIVVFGATIGIASGVERGGNQDGKFKKSLGHTKKIFGDSLDKAELFLAGQVSLGDPPSLDLRVSLEVPPKLSGRSRGKAFSHDLASAFVRFWYQEPNIAIEIGGELDLHLSCVDEKVKFVGGVGITEDEVEAFFDLKMDPGPRPRDLNLNLRELAVEIGFVFDEEGVGIDAGAMATFSEDTSRGRNTYMLGAVIGLDESDPVPYPMFEALMLRATSLTFEDLVELHVPPLHVEAKGFLAHFALYETFAMVVNAGGGALLLPNGEPAGTGFSIATALRIYGFDAYVAIAASSSGGEIKLQTSAIDFGPVKITGHAKPVETVWYSTESRGKKGLALRHKDGLLPLGATEHRQTIVKGGGPEIVLQTKAPYLKADLRVELLGLHAHLPGDFQPDQLGFSFVWSFKGLDDHHALHVELSCRIDNHGFYAHGKGDVRPGNIIPDGGKFYHTGEAELTIDLPYHHIGDVSTDLSTDGSHRKPDASLRVNCKRKHDWLPHLDFRIDTHDLTQGTKHVFDLIADALWRAIDHARA
ncbi:MAG: hypothetical protein KF773_40725 [Deltaproteobacteria bacterium]|nr:hypothetical protein [Deltaproteobacteria bacterium]